MAALTCKAYQVDLHFEQVPSKVLLRSPEVLEAARGVGGARERVNANERVDVHATFRRRDAITAGKDDTKILVPMVENTGVHIVRGTGQLNGVKRVKVTPFKGEPVELEARLAVALCTGSEPILADDIPGLREADPWMPRDATSSSRIPEHLIVMGAGAVGCEMANAYARYGAKVTVVCPYAEILSTVDVEAGKIVRESTQFPKA